MVLVGSSSMDGQSPCQNKTIICLALFPVRGWPGYQEPLYCSHNLLMVCYIPYKIYGRKNDDCLLLTIKVFAKKVFFSQPQKEFPIWSLWVKIFLHRPQKLKKLGFESFKNTPLKIRATPCTYSGKLQFANTHCGNVFIIKFLKL